MVRPPPHTPVNVPEMDEDVWFAIRYWKLPHVLGFGCVGVALVDTNVPTSEASIGCGRARATATAARATGTVGWCR